jgi:hypothetical protein
MIAEVVEGRASADTVAEYDRIVERSIEEQLY